MPGNINDPEFNYYLAYKIDPAEKDVKKIETAMARRKNTFIQGSPIQRELIELYASAVKIMTDPGSREVEFQRAKNFKLEAAEEAFVAIVISRGEICKKDLRKIFEKMADASGKWLTVDEIEKKVEYSLTVAYDDHTKIGLDFLTYDKIEKLLKIIGKSDLYDLLGVSQYHNAIADMYKTVVGKTDIKSTTICQVCGEAKKIFRDRDSRKYYNIYLATKDIWVEFALRRSVGITEIEYKEFLYYSTIVRYKLKTFDVCYVKKLLAEGLNYFRITVVGGDAGAIEIQNADGPTTTVIEKCTKSYGLAAHYNGVDIVRNIIFKDTVKPAHEEREFGTSSANQSTISLRVYENNSIEEDVPIDESTQMTQMYESCLVNLTPGLPEDAPINIIFDLDGNGVLTITAVDLTNNIPLDVTTMRIGGATNNRARLT